MDRAVLELARAAGVNLAADYYTKPGHAQIAGRQTLGRLLRDVDSAVNTAHFWTGPTLVVRSKDWAASYDREPVTAVIDRWELRTAAGKALQYPDYSFAATALADLQIGRLSVHADEHGRRLWHQEVDLLSQNRHTLRGLASLTSSQVNRMRAQDGLLVKLLTIPQSRAWRAALRPLALYPREALSNVRIRLLDRDPIPSVTVVGLPTVGGLELVRELKLSKP
jgi:hypothetical protein